MEYIPEPFPKIIRETQASEKSKGLQGNNQKKQIINQKHWECYPLAQNLIIYVNNFNIPKFLPWKETTR